MTAQDPHSASPDLAGLRDVRERLARAADDCDRDPAGITLVCVSKTFPAEAIEPVLAAGERVFGENRVQEAQRKWPDLRAGYPDLELHLIGPLQTNKAREAVQLFDVIETLDRIKLAEVLAAWGRADAAAAAGAPSEPAAGPPEAPSEPPPKARRAA